LGSSCILSGHSGLPMTGFDWPTYQCSSQEAKVMIKGEFRVETCSWLCVV
jgi:hypothetical protein